MGAAGMGTNAALDTFRGQDDGRMHFKLSRDV